MSIDFTDPLWILEAVYVEFYVLLPFFNVFFAANDGVDAFIVELVLFL